MSPLTRRKTTKNSTLNIITGSARSAPVFFKRQMLREEWQRLRLQPFGDPVQMIAVIALVKVRDAVIGQYFIQFLGCGGNDGVFSSCVLSYIIQSFQFLI